MTAINDSYTKGGAERLARTITRKWRNHAVKVWAEQKVVAGQPHPLWFVRSNLVKGAAPARGRAAGGGLNQPLKEAVMAETADSLYRRGMISDKQASKLGVLKKTKVQKSKMANFDDKGGKRDQGAGKEHGDKAATSRSIDTNQSASSAIAGKPSKGGSVANKGSTPGANEINKNGKAWPAEKHASAKTPLNPKSKGKIAKQGGQYGGGGRDTQ